MRVNRKDAAVTDIRSPWSPRPGAIRIRGDPKRVDADLSSIICPDVAGVGMPMVCIMRWPFEYCCFCL